MKQIFLGLITVIMMLPSLAAASGNVKLFDAPIVVDDKESLRRGAEAFANYCFSCHSLKHMRYNRIAADLEMSDDDVRAMFIHTRQPSEDPSVKGKPTKVGELMTVSMTDKFAEKAFGTKVPDLSLTARARGADWVYSYLRSFYADPYRPTGFNNSVFPLVGMPHVLWRLQGIQEPVYETVKHGDIEIEELTGFNLVQEGELSRVEYDMFIADLTNFLVYSAEPAHLQRSNLGWKVLLFLVIFFFFAYALKKDYWKDIH